MSKQPRTDNSVFARFTRRPAATAPASAAPTAKAPRTPRASLSLSSLTKKKTDPTVRAAAQPSRTSFDLLEGGFATARNTRRFNLGLTLLFATAMVFSVGTAFVSYVQKASRASSISVAQSSISVLNAKIAASTAGGQTPSSITLHHKSRLATIAGIENQSIDFEMVLTQFQAAAPPGSQTSSVVLGVSPSSIVPVTTTTVAGVPAPPPVPTSPSATGTPVTVIYVLPSPSSAAIVQQALNSLTFVVPGSVQFSGSIGSGTTSANTTVTVTFVALLNSKADISRAGGL